MAVISAFYEHCYTILTLYKVLNQSAMLWFIHVDQMKASHQFDDGCTTVQKQKKKKKAPPKSLSYKPIVKHSKYVDLWF